MDRISKHNETQRCKIEVLKVNGSTTVIELYIYILYILELQG